MLLALFLEFSTLSPGTFAETEPLTAKGEMAGHCQGCLEETDGRLARDAVSLSALDTMEPQWTLWGPRLWKKKKNGAYLSCLSNKVR